ncbi:MAG: polysaccharide deacetylase family protein [Sporichthyaceae bacterium]
MDLGANNQHTHPEAPALNGPRLHLLHPRLRRGVSRRSRWALGSVALAYAVGIGVMEVASDVEAHASAPAPAAAVVVPGAPLVRPVAAAPVSARPKAAPSPARAVAKVAVAPRRTPSTAAAWASARARHRPLWTADPHPVRRVDCTHLKCIALTFDDGPIGGSTDRLLQVLAREHVRATFFVIGKNVAADPGPLIRAAWDGHEIGIHTWDHRNLRGRGTVELAEDISRTSAVVARYSGFVPNLVRPPFGSIDASTARRIPYPLVLWSVDPDDWRDQNRTLVHDRVTAAAGPGSVVLLHDPYRESIAAVPKLIAHYRKRGYTFVTVSELFQRRLAPHEVYRGRELEVSRARAADRAAGRVREPYVAPELRTEPTAKPTPTPSPDPTPDPSPDPSPDPTPSPTPSTLPGRETEAFPTATPSAPGSRRS